MIPCNICSSESRFAFEKNGYKLYRCNSCGHLFVHPIPSAEEIEAVYRESYFHKSSGETGLGYADYDSDKAGLATTFDRYLDKLGKLTDGRRILDVGCATGFFLDRAKQKGWKTAGVEISEFGAKESNRRGHDCVHGVIEDISGASRFDIITLWDVFEHMSDPKSALARTNQLLSPGGLVAINTVDSGSVPAKLLGKRWHLVVPPEHLQYFTRASLRKIVEDAGFEVVSIHRITKRFSLAYIFTILYRWQRLSLWRNLAELSSGSLKKVNLPIQTFDNLYILGRKRK